MLDILYPIGFGAYRLGLHLAALFGHAKARKAITGRRGWAKRLEGAVEVLTANKSGPWIHVHCASLGEYEQAAPILDAFREQAPHRPILLTFFSPSGKESVPDNAADHVDYLPFDSWRNMRRFDAMLPAEDTILIKYELWPRLMDVRWSSGRKVHLVAARFDPGRHPADRWGGWMRARMANLTQILVQDAPSAQTIGEFGLHSDVVGDPRVDRVLSTVRNPPDQALQPRLDRLDRWRDGRSMLVVGSAWQGDWLAIRQWLPRLQDSDWCLLVAPHEVTGRHVQNWTTESGFPRSSHFAETDFPRSKGLILDEIGLLKHAYGLGAAAIVGGGWGDGVHNTLEAAAFGLPIAVGPKIAGFREIESLRSKGGLTVCSTPDDLCETIGRWMSPAGEDVRTEAGRSSAAWVSTQSGAGTRIAERILGLRDSTENREM